MSYSRLLGLRIRQVPLFRHLREPDRDELEHLASVRKFEPGQVLAAENSSPGFMMVLLSGSVDIRKNNPDGMETVLRRQGPPTVFGYCLLSDRPFTADIVAADAVVAGFFPLEKTKSILLRSPETLLAAVGHLSSLVEDLSQERIELKAMPLIERMKRVLTDIADRDGVCRISHEELGRMAGGSRSNVSRALKKLEEEGWARPGHRQVTLCNIASE